LARALLIVAAERSSRGLELVSIFEVLGILTTSFILNIIPFAGPSNLFIASNVALAFNVDPLTIGILVAFGSASAKFIHYLVTFFVGKFIGEKRRKRLDVAGAKLKRWAFLALFVVAATPLPDEPVIIPLGLLRYNPAKLFAAYFAGKLVVALAGAYLGRFTHEVFFSAVSNEVIMVISIVVTIIITVVLLKIDVTKIAEKMLKRKIRLGEHIESDS
jgi:membrane protein DedA with SNARE-associated domain